MWGAAKAVWRGKFMALTLYKRNEDRPQINSLSTYLKKWKREDQKNKPKASRRKEILTAKINETEDWKTVEKIQWNKKLVPWEKKNNNKKIDKYLGRMTEIEKEISNIRDETRKMMTYSAATGGYEGNPASSITRTDTTT